GEMQGVSSRYLTCPTPRMCEPLRFRQVTLAPAQRFFRKLTVANVHYCSNKLEFARFISFSASHNVDMFHRAIRHQQAMLKIKILPFLGRALDDLFLEGHI